MEVQGTVWVAVLEGDPNRPNLVASSVYDTKPVHYLSMVSPELKWIVREKACFNVETGEVENLYFLRMNHIHNYNSTMGDVYVSDQLRGTYRIDFWVQNQKWWWSILFWAIGVLLVNAYVVYLTIQ